LPYFSYYLTNIVDQTFASTMPVSVRFTRIAEDLERLPCELHDAVLKDLEFEQLLRLSQTAGPRLAWSLENSLSPWSLYLRQGNIQTLCSLLEITI